MLKPSPPLDFCPLHSRIDQVGKTARTLIDLPRMDDWAPRLVPLPSSSVTVPYNCGQLCTLVPKPQHQLFLLPGQSVWNPKRSHFQTGEVPLLLNQFCLKNMNALVLLSGFWMHGLVPGNALKLMGELKIRSVSLFRHHLDVIASVNVIVIHKNEAMKPIEIL